MTASKKIPAFGGKGYQSMRNNDFSPEAAIAEVIDNSFEAGAKNVKIRIVSSIPSGKKKPRPNIIAFGDDGNGMNEDTLKFDLKRFQEGDGAKTGNRTVLKEVPITIAGFANNIGGILFIGVDDNGQPLGLNNDFELLGGRDKFEQEITNALREIDNMAFVSHLSILFQEKNGKIVCIIQVPPSKKPIYVKNNEINELHVRVNNTTKKFEGKDLADYLEQHYRING